MTEEEAKLFEESQGSQKNNSSYEEEEAMIDGDRDLFSTACNTPNLSSIDEA